MKNPLSVTEALQKIDENSQEGKIINKNLTDAMNHVLSQEIKADRDLPPFNRSAVDGYAIRSEDLNGYILDTGGNPRADVKEFNILGTVLAGSHNTFAVKKDDCVHIMTGAAVPDGFDAVVKVEVSHGENGKVRFDKTSVEPWSNISRRGEDAKKGDTLVKPGMFVDPSMVHIAAACGINSLRVKEKPSVSLVTTGDELVSIEETPLPHQIRDSSSYSIEILLKDYEMSFRTRIRARDIEKEIHTAIKEGLKSDILIVTGGVSMGVTDFVPEIFDRLGVKQIFHKVKIKPGYPIWFGKSKNGCAVFGLPGNPVSTQIGFKVFVEPYIRKFMGMQPQEPVFLPLISDKTKKHDREEYAQAKIVNKDGKSFIQPIKHHGSGDFVNLLGSNGLMIHPADVKTIREGEYAAFLYWRSV